MMRNIYNFNILILIYLSRVECGGLVIIREEICIVYIGQLVIESMIIEKFKECEEIICR